jgi:hypothetical protein
MAMPSLDFAKSEVQALMLQVVHQVGPGNCRVERETHFIVAEKLFGNAMLEQLEKALRSVAQNWESWRAAATFALLARRILSLTVHPEVSDRSLRYLTELRLVFMAWLQRLKQRAASTTNSKQRTDLYSRLIELALLCYSTFDVEETFFDIIFGQPGAISALIQCSIVIRENQETAKPEFEAIHNVMLQDWRTLSSRLFPRLHQYVLLDSEDLNEAVSATWAAFRPTNGIGWTSLDHTHKNWLCTTSGALPVNFNLLTGELLINGMPLARLPDEYTKHRMYPRLFQKSILDVGPTDEPGMRFSAKSTHHGHKLHFGMNGKNMLVLAIKSGLR